VLIRRQSLETPHHAAVIVDNYRVLQNGFRRLEAIGFFADQDWPTTNWRPGDPPPLRGAVRHSADYCLRIVDELRLRTGDVLNGLILVQLVRETTAGLGDSRARFARSDGPPLAPDALKAPVGATAVAERLRVDRETVRRRLVTLAADGLVERRGQGYIVPEAALIRLKVPELIETNGANLRRLYRGLARVGAIEAWRAEAEATAAA